MKTEQTISLERAIRRATRKMGVFGCFEVTIGFFGKERVDYMTYDTKGIFRCYEIKVSKADFHSDAKQSFVGHYNYYVLTKELYEAVKDEIPAGIGAYVGGTCVKRPTKVDIDNAPRYEYRRSVGGQSTIIYMPYTDMLKESLIRSLYRDSDKLLMSGDEQFINRLKARVEKAENLAMEEGVKYSRLYHAVETEIGHDLLREIVQRAEI